MKWKNATRFGKRTMAIVLSLALVFSGTSITGKRVQAAVEDDKAEVVRDTVKGTVTQDESEHRKDKDGNLLTNGASIDRERIVVKSAQDPSVYAEIVEANTIAKGQFADGSPYEMLSQYNVIIHNDTNSPITGWELKIDRSRAYTSYQVGWNGVSLTSDRKQINVGPYKGVPGEADVDNLTVASKGYQGGAGFQVASRELADAKFSLAFNKESKYQTYKENATVGHPSSLQGVKKSDDVKVILTPESSSYDPKNYHQYYLKIKNNTNEEIKDWIIAFKTSDITGVDDWLWLFDDKLYREHLENEGTDTSQLTEEELIAPWKDLRIHAFYTGSYLYVAPQRGSYAGSIPANGSFGYELNDQTHALREQDWCANLMDAEPGDGKSHVLGKAKNGVVYEVEKSSNGLPVRDENGDLKFYLNSQNQNEAIQVLADNIKKDDVKFSYYGNIETIGTDDQDKVTGTTKATVYYSTTEGFFDSIRDSEDVKYGATRPNDISTDEITLDANGNPIIERDTHVYIGKNVEKELEAFLTPVDSSERSIQWSTNDPSKLRIYDGDDKTIETKENVVKVNLTDAAEAGDELIVTARLPYWQTLPGAPNVGVIRYHIHPMPLEGTGTESDPYLIKNEQDLRTLQELVNGSETFSACDFEGEEFAVVNDIALNGTWTPIGTEAHPFQGTMRGYLANDPDGRHTIKNITISNSSENYQGFFGYIGSEGIVANLDFAGRISAHDYVGGIVGKNEGTIQTCSSDVRVTGHNNVGGVAGSNANHIDNTIYGYGGYTNKENTGNNTVVSGANYVGGLVGINEGETSLVTFGRMAGTVTLPESLQTLIGPCPDGSGEEYYHPNNSPYIGVIAGYTENHIISEAFAGCYYRQDKIINANLHAIGNTCPEPEEITHGSGTFLFEGNGTAADPYLIKDESDLIELCNAVNDGRSFTGVTFRLTENITLGDDSDWTPIGDFNNMISTNPDSPVFGGIFLGYGHWIKNLHINAIDKDYQGLFGYNRGRIENLDIYGEVLANDFVGGIAGLNRGTIVNCHSYVTVKGNKNVGGIAGSNEIIKNTDGTQTGGNIESSDNHGDVTGKENTGGIAGNNSGTIKDSQNIKDENGEDGKKGTVTGGVNTGGIAGTNEKDGTIDNGKNKGDIIGKENTGGIAGKNDGNIKNSKNEGSVNGKKDGDGEGGDNTGGIAGDNNGNITDSDNSGDIHGDGDNTGGIAGTNEKDGNIKDTNNTGNVDGDGNNTGGIAGKNDGNIEGSTNGTKDGNDGKVTGGGDNTGGITGENNGNIDKGHNHGDVDGDGDNTGGVAGKNNGTIKDSDNDGDIHGKGDNTGGIAGTNEKDGNIKDTNNTGNVDGDGNNTGGIAGKNDGNIEGSDNNGKVTGGGDNTGGITGDNNGNIKDSDNDGDIHGKGDNTGGIAGTNEKDGNIKDTNNTGNVDGDGNNTGGIAGKNDGNIEGSTNGTKDGDDGKVTGGGDNTGGITGENNGNIDKSHNNGDVEGNGNNTGGVAGKNDGTITDSDNDGKVTGGGNNTGGIAGTNGDQGTINNGNNKGEVTGNGDHVGGVVGENNNPTPGSVSGTYVKDEDHNKNLNGIGGDGANQDGTSAVGNVNGGDQTPNPDTNNPVFTPGLSTLNVLLQTGKSYKLTTNDKSKVKITKVKAANAKSKKLVKVTKAGKITAKKKTGTAKVKVTYKYENTSYTKTVKVKIQKNAVVVLSKKKLTAKMKVKKKFNIVNPANMLKTNGLKSFKSSNKKVATVNKKGVVTTKKKGTAKITVKLNGVEYTVTVKVK